MPLLLPGHAFPLRLYQLGHSQARLTNCLLYSPLDVVDNIWRQTDMTPLTPITWAYASPPSQSGRLPIHIDKGVVRCWWGGRAFERRGRATKPPFLQARAPSAPNHARLCHLLPPPSPPAQHCWLFRAYAAPRRVTHTRIPILRYYNLLTGWQGFCPVPTWRDGVVQAVSSVTPAPMAAFSLWRGSHYGCLYLRHGRTFTIPLTALPPIGRATIRFAAYRISDALPPRPRLSISAPNLTAFDNFKPTALHAPHAHTSLPGSF